MTDTSLCRTVAALVLVAAGISSALAQSRQPLIRGTQTLFPRPAELVLENDNSPAFGNAVAIRGNRAVVSMFKSESETRLALFERDASGTWQRTGTIETPTGFNIATFHSLALGESRVVLGLATSEVQVFVRSGTGWAFEQELFPPGQSDPVTPIIGFDQGWLAIGTRGSCCLPRVSMFSRRNGSWTMVQSLTNEDDPTDLSFALDFAIDAGTLAVSSAQDGVHIYRLNGNGVWVRRQLITPPSGAVGFGESVAIGNGLIAIGAPFTQRSDPPICGTAGASGAVYVYGPSGPTWVLRQVLSHRSADCHFRFGSDVAITGTHLAVSSDPFFQNYRVIDGKTVLYRRTTAGTFSILGRDEGFFGSTALALSGATMLVGVLGDEIAEGGAVIVYDPAQVVP